MLNGKKKRESLISCVYNWQLTYGNILIARRKRSHVNEFIIILSGAANESVSNVARDIWGGVRKFAQLINSCENIYVYELTRATCQYDELRTLEGFRHSLQFFLSLSFFACDICFAIIDDPSPGSFWTGLFAFFVLLLPLRSADDARGSAVKIPVSQRDPFIRFIKRDGKY